MAIARKKPASEGLFWRFLRPLHHLWGTSFAHLAFSLRRWGPDASGRRAAGKIPPYGATMGSSPEYVLLGDIGATNARLALLSKGLLGPIEWFTVAEFARFADAVDA